MTTCNTAQINAGRNAKNAQFEEGAGDAFYQYLTAADAVLAELELNVTKVAIDAVAGVSTLDVPKNGTAWNAQSIPITATGTLAKVGITDRDKVLIETWPAGVTGSGAETEVPSLALTSGNNIEPTAAPTLTEQATYTP